MEFALTIALNKFRPNSLWNDLMLNDPQWGRSRYHTHRACPFYRIAHLEPGFALLHSLPLNVEEANASLLACYKEEV